MNSTLKVALVGNPNCGKTTIFNGLTGGHVQTGNWPGVTVEKREGELTGCQHCKNAATCKSNVTTCHNPAADTREGALSATNNTANKIIAVDLPGIYTLSAHSEDEVVSRDYILSRDAQVIINIIDASNLERNLYLTTQLIEMNVPIIVVLNMTDIATRHGFEIDEKALSKALNVPVYKVCGVNKDDMTFLQHIIMDYVYKAEVTAKPVTYPEIINDTVRKLSPRIEHIAQMDNASSEWYIIKMLENDREIIKKILFHDDITKEEIQTIQKEIKEKTGDLPDVIIATCRYEFIQNVTSASVTRTEQKETNSDKIDKIVLNRILGIPIFLAMMFLLFWLTITVGGAFIDFFDILFGTIFVDGFAYILNSLHLPQFIVTLLSSGIGGGIQTVSTFIPVMFMMYFLLSMLEDSGYMSRAAFVMDRFMRFLGLPGKAFIALIVGFGCSVPAIMASRTLDSKKDRILTIFMTPLMSCGARLPVYALFGAAFFGTRSALIVFSLYMSGIIIAVLTGLLLSKTCFSQYESSLVLELPSYHAPRMKDVMRTTWTRLSTFIRRAGLMIIIVVCILSLLSSFGKDGSFGKNDTNNSVLSVIGQTVTPILEPMGVTQENWPATVGLFTGLFAKESIVGTLNSLYEQMESKNQVTDNSSDNKEFNFGNGIKQAFISIPKGLADAFSFNMNNNSNDIANQTQTFANMNKYFKTPFAAYAYLLFVLIYFPCIAAFSAICQEIGKKLGWAAAGYLTIVAWSIATLFYQLTCGHNVIFIIIPLCILLSIVGFLLIIGRTTKKLI